jgi:hypothetical protein
VVAVARLLADGAPDTGFSGDGVVRPPLGGTAAIANGVVSLGDGRVVVVGADESAESAFALMLGADGSFDPGDVTAVDSSPDLDGFESAYLDAGRMLAVGWANEQVAFARLHVDGSGGEDTTAPTLALPDAIMVDATSAAGAIVSYDASASDDVDPSPTVECQPASGATFSIGDTTVSCDANDASGNTSSGSFGIHVRGADEQLERLAAATEPVTPANVRQQLLRRLDEIVDALDRGKEHKACVELTSFTRTVQQRLTGPEGADLVRAAQRIAAVVGC